MGQVIQMKKRKKVAEPRIVMKGGKASSPTKSVVTETTPIHKIENFNIDPDELAGAIMNNVTRQLAMIGIDINQYSGAQLKDAVLVGEAIRSMIYREFGKGHPFHEMNPMGVE